MDRIRLQGMRFFVHAGSTEAERDAGHHLELDVEMGLDLRPAGEADDLEATVDYAAVHGAIEEAVAGGRYTLLEAVAEDAAAAAADALDHPVDELVVRARKPSPPVPGGVMDQAEVEIRREPDDA
jgi:dihydroneopterin aldolase